MTLFHDLSELAGQAFATIGLDPGLGVVVRSQRPELGQFQCNGALAGAKSAGQDPRRLAEQVAGILRSDPRVASIEIAGPGFLNITLNDAHLASVIEAISVDPLLGISLPPARHKIVVDYGGPNVAKDLHVGHIRPALIGESLKRTFALLGHEAVGDVHLGDWGAPMGQLIAEVEDRMPDLAYFDPNHAGPYPSIAPVTIEDLQEIYPTAALRARDDPIFAERTRQATVELQRGRPGYRALWQHFRQVSVTALEAVYDSLGVHFELWLGESSVHDRIAPMVERCLASGVALSSDGAVVIPVSDPADTHEIPPMMLANSRGGFTYATSDLATIEERVDDLGADEIVYIVDLRQSLHFQQVFRAARRTGIAPASVVLDHSGNGTVNGPDGKPFKTRDGNLPRLRDIITDVIDLAGRRLDENEVALGYSDADRAEIARLVGLAALKYGELSNHRASNYSFDLEKFTQLQGKTGPYVQYGATRIRSILRNAEGLRATAPIAPSTDSERALILELVRLPDVVERTAAQRAPNHLCEYAFELTSAFNRFYDENHILGEIDQARQGSWLTLVEVTLRVMTLVLSLLTIDIPERM